VQLDLTPVGKKHAERLVKVIVKVLNRHLDGFSADELALFKSFLRRMLANRDATC
jgi:DNA-binding MarR family transcriptional regulator